ncbi:MAG: TerC/Alx family metal homeostasis membrane protein [Gammaproteobacteria bacterium]|nr:TerC/Alx family metal homeostasis membrane protein [Gammaproteobacteria bacterium]MDH4314704.1 TerC/Alx family metal homeostasis membrane protein [Gammaproteobacteria bacterium]MDH5214564.1 TerC/Alx family metal homeostasis membrane protein [Gammaproteobacteria bacterium]MDH5500079.1 TerC/Alx family metal homeostasis membrane protein [Gammaproteobacteria bacterium]
MAISFTTLVWIGFLSLIAIVVALDLGVFHKKQHVISLPEALGWTAVWVSLAIAFNVGVYYLYEINPSGWDMDTEQLTGQEAAIQFFTGYLVEKSLSIDNVFVIAMIFAHFQVPLVEQHRVLFWGIFGAVVLRGLMIFGGIALIERYDWVVYVFGAILIFSAASMLIMRHDNLAPESNVMVRLVRRFYPVTTEFHGGRFFVTIDGVRHATPLLLALVLVETSDVTFAIDSIPAIFAITRDPFIVFTSNVFAILGLRSLYFVLAGLMEKFRYLKMSLVFLLAYIGVKMLLVHHYPIPNLVSLAVIGGILSVGILASMLAGRDTIALMSPLAGEIERLVLRSYRQARKVVILLLGSTVLLVGLAMILLPGPAVVVIPLGLAILGVEFAWARKWLNSIRQSIGDLTRKAGPPAGGDI